MSKIALKDLEPIINQLVLGTADTQYVAQKLKALGYPDVVDQAAQLRLALLLLECHDDSIASGTGSNRPLRRSKREPEAGL